MDEMSNRRETFTPPSSTHSSFADGSTLNLISGFLAMSISRRSHFVHGRKAGMPRRVESKTLQKQLGIMR